MSGNNRFLLPILICFGVLAAACSGPKQDANIAFDRLVSQIGEKELNGSPELALYLGENLPSIPLHSHLLDNRSQAEISSRASQRIEHLEALLRTSPDALNAENRRTLSVLTDLYDHAATLNAFGYGDVGLAWSTPYVITQLDGAYIKLPGFLASNHHIESLWDAEIYIERLKCVSDVMDDELTRFMNDVDLGVIPPRFILQSTINQAQTIRNVPAEDTFYVQAMLNALYLTESVTNAQRDALKQTAIEIIETEIYPAYDRLIRQLETLKVAATDDAGVWKLPRGEEYYPKALSLYTATDLSPDQVHALGLNLVEDLTHEMNMMLVGLGYEDGSVGKRMAQLTADPDHLFENSDTGRQELITYTNTLIDDMDAQLLNVFFNAPRTDVHAVRLPVSNEASAPGGYYASPRPQSNAEGIFYINLRDTADWPKWSLKTLTYHEAEPGHHVQTSFQQEMKDAPLMRRVVYYPAFGEGWALYAEDLADEMGVYTDDPLGRLGYLQSLLFRAARLVADTGMHHKQWSREQVIDYLVNVTGQTRTSMETEADRYAVWPGQASAYMIGRLYLRELRLQADRALGANFDVRSFHDVVLKHGGRPLHVVADDVHAWIKSEGVTAPMDAPDLSPEDTPEDLPPS